MCTNKLKINKGTFGRFFRWLRNGEIYINMVNQVQKKDSICWMHRKLLVYQEKH